MITISGLTRRFRRGSETITALDAVSLALVPGELTVAAGASGSGKTTLLSIIAGYERADSGTVTLNGAPTAGLPWSKLGFVPLDRGILETIYGSLTPGTTESQVAEAMAAAYKDAPFVRLTGSALPEIKHVVHTNFCDIGWKVDAERGRIVLVAVIDNLVKGAAGSAVQNLNVLLGLDERTGLL